MIAPKQHDPLGKATSIFETRSFGLGDGDNGCVGYYAQALNSPPRSVIGWCSGPPPRQQCRLAMPLAQLLAGQLTVEGNHNDVACHSHQRFVIAKQNLIMNAIAHHAVALGSTEVAGAEVRDQVFGEAQDVIKFRIRVDGKPSPNLPSHQRQGTARIAIRLPQHFDSARGSVIMLEGQRLSLDCCAGIKCQRGEGAR